MAFTQPATFNEPWSDARVASYLDVSAPKGIDGDYHTLLTAFKHMRAEDYQRLLARFVAAGRNVNATGPAGQTILDEISRYPRQSAPFLDILVTFGAVSATA